MITISRYVFAFFAILYTFESFWIITLKNPDQKRAVYFRQMIDITIIHLLAFVVLFLRTENMFYLMFGGITYLLIFFFQLLFRTIYRSRNKLLMNHICFFISNGFIMISRISQTKAVRQLLFVAVAMLIIAVVPIFIKKVGFIRKLGILYAAGGLFALGIVLILGATTNGAKISYTIFGFTFQPSEFVKILFVLFLAAFLHKNISLKRVFLTSCLAGAYVLVLVASKDLGTALIFVIVYVCVLYVATQKAFYFAASTILFLVAAVIAYFAFSHVKIRVDIWLNPWNDIGGKGYQITQALFAIGTGGLFGTGVGGGRPTTIPFVEADMIFAAFGEEFGLIYAICMILICLSCFYQFMKISVTLKDNFYRLCASGFAVMYLFQVLLTIGGSSKYIPLTGVTLPFVSYGGSSVITTGVIFAIIQGLYLVTTKEMMEEELVEASLTEEFEDGVPIQALSDDYVKELCDEKYAELEQEQEAPVRNNRREILSIMCLFTVVFVGLISYLTVFMARDAKTVIMNDYNMARIDKVSQDNIRGTIFTRDMEKIALTQESEDGTMTRFYPYAEVFAHVAGYTVGSKSGIEASENFYLSTSGESIKTEIDHELDGARNRANNVVTTLDLELQQAAYDALGSHKGAVIVMKADTGEILAMVSKPSYDPNQINTLLQDTANMDPETSYLLNRATQGLYPPGSTFKIVTALEFIEEHPEDYLEFAFDCSGAFETDDYTIHCYRNKSHGLVDLQHAFADSCNAAFASIALQLDRDSYLRTAQELLFNMTIPAPFGVNQSVIDLNEETTDATLMQIAIGQSTTLVTPMHIAMLTQAIANDGVLLEPYYIQSITNANDKIMKRYSAHTYGALMTQEEAAVLTGFMRETVASGTAVSISSRYQAAGKTGSAEFSNNSSKSHAWFTGFAPFDDPQVVITVIVEEAGTGSDYAVPIASKLLKIYFDKYMEAE